MKRVIFKVIIPAILLLTLFGCSNLAPSKVMPSANSISGHVYQPDGRTPIDSVKIVATCREENLYHDGTAITASDGAYIVTNLTPGRYKVSARATGYRPEGYNGVDGISRLYNDPSYTGGNSYWYRF
jgi:hypothetical protein